MAEVVELDLDHAVVADAPVEGEALFEERGGRVQVAGQTQRLSVQVQGRLAHRVGHRPRVCTRQLRELAPSLVVAFVDRDATEPEVRERERLVVAERCAISSASSVRRRETSLAPCQYARSPSPYSASARQRDG